MTLTKKIGYNSSIQFSGRILMVFISLILVTFLTRYLGLEKYGNYTTALAFVALFNIFAEFGINQVIIREIARRPKKRGKIVGTGLFLKILTSLVAFLLPPLIAYFLPYPMEVKLGILICALAAFPITIASIFVTIFQIHLQMYRYVIASVSGRLFTLFLSLYFIKTEKTLAFFFLAILAGNLIEFLLDLILAVRLEKIIIIFDKKLYRNILLQSLPLAIALGIGTIAFRTDMIILSLMKDQSAVGIYGVPYKVVDILITVPGIFIGLVLPIFSKYLFTSRRRLLRSVQKAFDAMLVCGSYFFVIIFLLAPFIVNLVAGSGFSASTTPLRFLAWAIWLLFLNIPFGYLLVAAGKQIELIWRNLFLLIANILLNLILIPALSYNGAALATVLAELFSLIISLRLVWQLLKIFPSFRRIWGVLASSLVSFFVGFLLIKANIFISWQHFVNFSYGQRIISFLAVFAIVSFFYFVFLILFKGVDRQIAAQFIPIKYLKNEKK